MIQYIVYFYPPQTVAVNTKELSRDTPYNLQKILNTLHTPYLFSNTTIGNATSGTGVGWRHWKAFTVPTKL